MKIRKPCLPFRKVWILLTVGVLTIILVGCAARQQDAQIEKVSNLAEILAKTAELTQQFESKEITAEQFATLTRELEDKYEELTKNTIEEANEEIETMQKNLDEQFETIQKTIDNVKGICNLPDRAEKL